MWETRTLRTLANEDLGTLAENHRRTHFVRILCEQGMCGTHRPAFLGTTTCGNNTVELTGLAAALRWNCSFIPRGESVRIFRRFLNTRLV